MNTNKTASRAMQRAWALLLAAALCLGLTPATAWAEGGSAPADSAPAAQAAAGTVTLTIVQGVGYSGPQALINKSYEFKGKATVADLFEAAKTAGDLKDYAFNSSGYLDSVTLASGVEVKAPSDWTSYWSIYKNDQAAGFDQTKPEEGKNIDALADGDAFQFAWCDSVSNIAPTAEQWKVLAGVATAGSGIAGDATKDKAGSATLSIVKSVDYTGPKAVLNKTYAFTQDATVENLFAAAKAAGDIKDYAFNSSGYLDSVTLVNGEAITTPSDRSSSWSIYKNDQAAGFDQAKPEEGKNIDALADGDAFQFAWCDSVSNIAPTSEQWKALSAAAVPGDETAEGDGAVNPTPPNTKVDVAALDGSLNTVYRTLFTNLSGTLAGSGGVSERNISSWKAMEAAAIGQVDIVDVDAAISEALSAYNAPKDNNLQRCIIVLTALGVDPTKVPSGQDTVNLVDKLASDASAVTAYPTSAAFALLAYASGSYQVDADAVNAPRVLIDKLAAAQSTAGGYMSMGTVDVDTTAMVIPALASYQGDATAKEALDKAVAALRTTQKEDGGFGNLNSTAVAVIALCSIGIDPSSEDEWAASGATPLKALLASAKSDMSGFAVSTGMQEDMVNEQGFRALIAYQGLKNTGAAYNIYTQAKLGQAALPADDDKQKPQDEDTTVPAKVSDKKMLAKTGDGAIPFAAGASAVALSALVGAVIALRRTKDRNDSLLHR